MRIRVQFKESKEGWSSLIWRALRHYDLSGDEKRTIHSKALKKIQEWGISKEDCLKMVGENFPSVFSSPCEALAFVVVYIVLLSEEEGWEPENIWADWPDIVKDAFQTVSR